MVNILMEEAQVRDLIVLLDRVQIQGAEAVAFLQIRQNLVSALPKKAEPNRDQRRAVASKDGKE